MRQVLTAKLWLTWNSLYRPDWPQIHRDSHNSVSQVLGLNVYTTIPN